MDGAAGVQAYFVKHGSYSNLLTKPGGRPTKGPIKSSGVARKARKAFMHWKPNTKQMFQFFMNGDPDPNEPLAATPEPEAGMDQEPTPCTVTEAIMEKYEDWNGKYGHSPVKTDQEGTLKLPISLILEDLNIAYAGERESLCRLCGRVQELDLSYNDVDSWNEVLSVLLALPQIRELNLTKNRRLSKPTSIPDDFSHASLRNLVLINTSASLQTVSTLITKLPSLQELHLSLNCYSSISEHMPHHPTLKTLYFTDNQLSSWEEVYKLSDAFPALEYLYLTNNCLGHVSPPPSGQAVFPSLQSLFLSGNDLDCWECLDNLNHVTSLKALRVANIPFFDAIEESERRMLSVARLKSVDNLNGSAISNRTAAERFFIRYYLDEEPKPSRYYELVDIHGELTKLGDVNLSPREQISLSLVCEDMELTQQINVKPNITVRELKVFVSNIIGVRDDALHLSHVDPYTESVLGEGRGASNLRLMSIKLSTAGVDNGHKIKAFIR